MLRELGRDLVASQETLTYEHSVYSNLWLKHHNSLPVLCFIGRLATRFALLAEASELSWLELL